MRHSHLHVSYNQKIISDPLQCSEDCFDYFKHIWDKDTINIQEQVYILYLNGHNQVICWRCFNTGNATETLFDVKFMLACGLGCLAVKIILGHNHPSGILKPSRSDIVNTGKISNACRLVDMTLEEHLIIGRSGYYSFVDHGIIKM